MSLEEEITNLIAEKFSVNKEKVTAKTRFKELGADELSIIEFQMDLEDRYVLDISEEDALNLDIVEKTINYVKKYQNTKKVI